MCAGMGRKTLPSGGGVARCRWRPLGHRPVVVALARRYRQGKVLSRSAIRSVRRGFMRHLPGEHAGYCETTMPIVTNSKPVPQQGPRSRNRASSWNALRQRQLLFVVERPARRPAGPVSSPAADRLRRRERPRPSAQQRAWLNCPSPCTSTGIFTPPSSISSRASRPGCCRRSD